MMRERNWWSNTSKGTGARQLALKTSLGRKPLKLYELDYGGGGQKPLCAAVGSACLQARREIRFNFPWFSQESGSRIQYDNTTRVPFRLNCQGPLQPVSRHLTLRVSRRQHSPDALAERRSHSERDSESRHMPALQTMHKSDWAHLDPYWEKPVRRIARMTPTAVWLGRELIKHASLGLELWNRKPPSNASNSTSGKCH